MPRIDSRARSTSRPLVQSSTATPTIGSDSDPARSIRYSDRNVITLARSPVIPNTTNTSAGCSPPGLAGLGSDVAARVIHRHLPEPGGAELASIALAPSKLTRRLTRAGRGPEARLGVQLHFDLVASVKLLTELLTLAALVAIAATWVAEGLDGSALAAV